MFSHGLCNMVACSTLVALVSLVLQMCKDTLPCSSLLHLQLCSGRVADEPCTSTSQLSLWVMMVKTAS